MKKQLLLVLCLVLTLLLLAGCAQKEEIPTIEAVQASLDAPATPTVAPITPVETITGVEAGYDPASEEDNGTGFYTGVEYDEMGNVAQVGATPLALDPIDMPTATPRPSLVFTYASHTTSNMAVNITFDAPADWIVDESIPGVLTLTDPEVRDGYQGYIMITMVSKESTYKKTDIKNEINTFIGSLHATNFNEWRTESVETRTLLGKDGYYTTYRGVRYDGVIIRGRVHMALLDNNRLITIHVSAPGWYNESYNNVYKKIRETIKTI